MLSTLFGLFPFLQKLFADSAYQGPIFREALSGILPELEIEIGDEPITVNGVHDVLPVQDTDVVATLLSVAGVPLVDV